ncbi:hypothetical protein EV193_10713 [Herbihabitans rhizosphaerae]|uniref:Multicopper oxidase n=1 Tax=Herbihabitans rhizosphaerae TaxID=1872711 RepID=A0A4Q7KMB2_9PSEU|nr:hypothetical protein [Herbihabitans rhizosphaerae]RZS36332.1 hypothetical protein EV193_10713 [Herbihabitans rhizosphaerae]
MANAVSAHDGRESTEWSGAAAVGGSVLSTSGPHVALAVFLAVGAVLWQFVGIAGVDPFVAPHFSHLLVDVMLAVPAASLAIGVAGAVTRRVGVPVSGPWGCVARAAVISVVLTAVYVPLGAAQAVAHAVLGNSAGSHGGHDAISLDPATLFAYGADQALRVEVAVMLLSIIGLGAVAACGAAIPPRLTPRTVLRTRRASIAVRTALTAVLLTVLVPAQAGAEAPPQNSETGADGCATAPRRTFDVSAIDVDTVVDRFGDHDPYGYMYVLADREDDVRAQEAALLQASWLDKDDPAAAKVSPGLGQDPIQPLVMRARLGECVVVNLTNKIKNSPRGGPLGDPPIVQPGGVPSVSIDMSGVSYDAAEGAGGQPVGRNPTSVMAAPGETKQYRYFLDPQMGEGAKIFRSGGESTQLTAHGLFGVLVAEPAGARWFDPATGADRTSDTTWSNWEAMIRPVFGPAFREFTLIYHEVGDENFNLRRPLRENDEGIPIGGDPGVPVGDQHQYGRPLPMVDVRPPTPTIPNEGGGGTNGYRPGSRAINYRSEPFYRRLQLEAGRGADAQKANRSLAYSSYTYGDPATPMPRSYLGEPTKTRLVHAGGEQLHVHHVHGGGTRWRLNPGTDGAPVTGGLSKTPADGAGSIRLDSQTVSPMETFNLEHECGAGGCQQAAGDFLYHCHIGHHYITGMWGLWRVFDTRQPGLAPLPGRAPPADAVGAAGLIGRVVDGKRVVGQGVVTDPAAEVPVDRLVEQHLPPRGARWAGPAGPDPDDATVWDWQRDGPPGSPTYLGEPETTSVWANYRSPTPGIRPEIMFNPETGRPAYPMLRPHLGMRPPFSPNNHSGSPGLGETASRERPAALCPRQAPTRSYDVTAVAVPVQATNRERDNDGELYVLNDDKAAVLQGRKPTEPLVIRSNVGDCVAITFGSELNPAVQAKANMHAHLVQFDPLASDGVVAGFAYEQSVFNAGRDGRTLTSADSPNRITVSTVDRLRPGVSVGVGVGRPNVEIRTITAILGNQLVLDRPLTKPHVQGEPVTVEFTQYRWFSDVDAGTVFWHDHVDAIRSWAHGLFAALIIEPPGSTYHDPVTGAEVRSGANVDIVNTSGSVGVGQSGSFREFTVFLHNGRRGRTELGTPPPAGLAPFNSGQECEEGSINLRAAPLGERTPPGANPADPATTQQRQEYNGSRCRNAFSRAPGDVTNPDANTARATVTSVDPYAFSSVKYGDPMTPLLRAYAGDPVVVRTIGLGERAEALRVQGHRFRVERFRADGRLTDTATTGISERFDYVLDGGAGGPAGSPGDYLYYSTRTFALESGAWGLFRVHDRLRPDLRPLPNRPVPGAGRGFPVQVPATGDTQRTPGPDPASAHRPDGTVDTGVVTSSAGTCPVGARTMAYDVSVIDTPLPTAPYRDSGGVVYALTSDVPAIQRGEKAVEPLVLRANKGDCVRITLRNQIRQGSLYGGTRAGIDLAKLARNQQTSAGAAIGLNPDSSVGVGQVGDYAFYADQELGTSLFQNLASPASLRHGAYGMLIVEPAGSTWSDSRTGVPFGPTSTGTQAIVAVPGRAKFREFALTMQSTDQQFGRSILPYGDQVAGNGLNSPTAANRPVAPVPGAPPGTGGNTGSFDKGYNSVNYHTAPLTERLGLTAYRDDFTAAPVIGSYGTAFGSTPYGEPATPVFQAHSGDPVVFRVGIGASDQVHSFAVTGHTFPIEPRMPNSEMLTARSLTAGETLDAWMSRAGSGVANDGDYLFMDARMPFMSAGIWGIFRVQRRDSTDIAPL